MTGEINFSLAIRRGENESVFLQRAVNVALQAFRKTHDEAGRLLTTTQEVEQPEDEIIPCRDGETRQHIIAYP